MTEPEALRAVITGAASGIGRATALLFARQGARLVIADKDAAGLETTRAAVAEQTPVHTLAGDVAEEGTSEQAVALADRELGGLDFFFANAGVSGNLVPLLELGAEDWLQVLRINTLGAFFGIKHAARYMLSRGGGSIACTASVAALRAGAGPAHYSASKAAIVNLVQNAAAQLAGTGIRVNAVCPGLIETEMTRPLFEFARAKGNENKIGQLNPTRRAGRPEEIAEVVAFLASSKSSYLNGQAVVVDGGLSASLPFIPGKIW